MPPSSSKRRYKGYVARNLVDKHSWKESPQTNEELLELTKVEASTLGERMKSWQIPVKYEHEDKVIDIGRVVNTWTGKEDLEAEFELDEHLSANLVAELIDNFKLNGLSLTHLPKSLEPIELSICAKGA